VANTLAYFVGAHFQAKKKFCEIFTREEKEKAVQAGPGTNITKLYFVVIAVQAE